MNFPLYPESHLTPTLSPTPWRIGRRNQRPDCDLGVQHELRVARRRDANAPGN